MKLITIFLVCGVFIPQGVKACQLVNGANTGNISLRFPDVIVQNDLPIGSVISSIGADVATHTQAAGMSSDLQPMLECENGGTIKRGESTFKVINYGGEPMLDSGVNGIGIKVRPSSGSTNLSLHWKFPPESRSNVRGRININNYGGVYFDLIKIAESTGSGIISSGNLVRVSIENKFYVFNYRLTSSKVTTTCQIDTPIVNVEFGNIRSSSFSGIGSNSVAKDFDIKIKCSNPNNVQISFNGVLDPDMRDHTVIALNNHGQENVASGVGIQIMREDMPVRLNTNIPLKVSSDKADSLNFKARYIQTRAKVSGGAANAIVTFNVTYS